MDGAKLSASDSEYEDELSSLIRQSEADGRPHSTTLPSGLIVEIDVQVQKFVLRTWRPQLTPDLKEWQTCFDMLPTNYRCAIRPTPVDYFYDGKNFGIFGGLGLGAYYDWIRVDSPATGSMSSQSLYLGF